VTLGEVRSIFSSSITNLPFSLDFWCLFFFFLLFQILFFFLLHSWTLMHSLKTTNKLNSILLKPTVQLIQEAVIYTCIHESWEIKYKIFKIASLLIPFHAVLGLDRLLHRHFFFLVGSQPESLWPAH
jgi:hypothetical protein